MSLALIAAMTRHHRVIGRDNQLPWHLPADLRHFKQLTQNNTVIMGRKTFESIGKALPQRRNIVLTRQADYSAPGCDVFSSWSAALDAVASTDKVFVIGGENLYQQTLAYADKLYLTFVDAEMTGDAFFPQWPSTEFEAIEQRTQPVDDKHDFACEFVTLKRINANG